MRIAWESEICTVYYLEPYMRFVTLHYAAFPIRKCQLEIWARFSPQPPFSWALIISDKIFGCQSLFSFTFKVYLGPSSPFPPIFLCFSYFRQNINALCDWNSKDQLNVALKRDSKYFGWLKQVNNIWQIFAPWRAALLKLLFSTFFLGMIWLLHTQSFMFHRPPFMFFANIWPIFDKYLEEIFFL